MLACHRFNALVLLMVLGVSAVDAGGYQVGDVATQDVRTPFQLIVIDPDETATLKEKEAAKIPVVFRYHTNASNEVDQRFRLIFANTRSNFLEAIEAAFNRRKLGTQAIASPKFQRTIANFQKRNKSFPVDTNLALIWATDESDRVLQSSLSAQLRETMSQPLRTATQPPHIRLGYALRLVALERPDDPLTLQDVERRGRNVVRTNVMTLKRAREEFQRSFPPEQQPLAKFLSGLLRTNCVPDMELTLEARAKRTEPLWAADRYEAGQLIVARGQVIDKKMQAALVQMEEKMPRPVLASVPAAPVEQWWSSKSMWMIAAMAAGLMLMMLFWRTRRRRADQWSPALIGPDQGVVLAPGQRASLVPYLARLMMDKLVSKLLWQRSHWLETQRKAIAEMTELEERLEKVHAPLQDRLRAYEQRIGDLEKQLARKGEENRELTKTKLQLARHQLAAARNRLDLN